MKGFFRYGSPLIRLIIKGNVIELLLDTGFNGYLMLPQALIDKLDLEQIGISDYVTASGEEKLTNVYKAELTFFDEKIEVPILSTDAHFSLAGMELFNECKIIIERHSGILEVIKSK